MAESHVSFCDLVVTKLPVDSCSRVLSVPSGSWGKGSLGVPWVPWAPRGGLPPLVPQL